jgi:hypothetical protein
MGCEGRPGASDIREPEVDRAWFVVCGAAPNCDVEFERFIAEAGIGIAVALWETAPSVCVVMASAFATSLTVLPLILTSRGRRTENSPDSCDILIA